MTLSTGFFINAKTHDVMKIHEHATAVVADPERFGLKATDIEGLHPRRDRFEVLAKVMKAGWIRVRRRKDDMSIEFTCTWVEAILAVAVNADHIFFGPMTFLIYRQIETGESIHTYASDVVEAVEERRIVEFVEEKIEQGVEK